MTNTIYANVVNLKISPVEIILEFLAFFPDRPGVAPPADLKPEARVVLNSSLLEPFANQLNQVVAQRRAGQPQRPGGLGFIPPPPGAQG